MSESLTAAARVAIARHPQRPNITDYIEALFTDFFEQKGDRLCGEDAAILGGVALYHGRPVTVIGTRKGKTLEENLKCNFGMPNPEGYRKALRLMRQAEKFRRPILTFIDTSGAYPGLEAEARGQGEAIARNLYEMSRLTVPVIALITGEGNSGGALALGVANRVLMLENSVYAILSPEGFASILWKDSARHEEACELMKLTAADLLAQGVTYDCVICGNDEMALGVIGALKAAGRDPGAVPIVSVDHTEAGADALEAGGLYMTVDQNAGLQAKAAVAAAVNLDQGRPFDSGLADLLGETYTDPDQPYTLRVPVEAVRK